MYKAFIVAGVPEEDAREAAEALSAENLATKSDVQRLETRVDGIAAQVNLLRWMVGFNLAFTMAVLWRLLS
ncbi:MAG: integrase [Gammaproteobacteria bacterium]|nr:integrase [Gammaproteobacteria bacterium]